MKSESSVLVYDRMSRIGSSLEADNDVRFVRQKVSDLTLSFVSPVSADNCLNHSKSSLIKKIRSNYNRGSRFLQ